MSSFAERIANLSPEKQKLLARLLQQEQLDVSRVTIGPREQTENIPLSFAQERLWFLDQLEPNRPIYNMPDSHFFKGPLDLEATQRSLSELVRRHEVLRTTFRMVDGAPVQVIAEPAPMPLPVIDISHLPEKERAAEAERLANEEAQKPFDLSRGPLFRAQLVWLQKEEHLLLLTMHHIISDGWSLGVMGREMTALYEAFKQGKPSPLPELAIQYADFAIWQREWLQGAVLEKQLDYWRRQFGGEVPEIVLPTDRPRPARQTYRGAAEFIELSLSASQRLKEIGRERGATLFMTLLAAFNVLLWRYSGQDDLLVGTPIANRNRAETENLIGFFVNTLVLRTKLRGEDRFNELLDRVRETTLGAYQHQDVPFEKLVEELHPERNLNRQPLFQVMFSLSDWESLELQEVELNWVQTEIRTVKFDMTLSMVTGQERFVGGLIYNIDLFDATTIKRMISQFKLLLESIATDPDQRLSELKLLTAAEEQLLVEWNDTKREYPQGCLHELFEAQVESTPEAVALAFKDEEITYEELNRRANQLAHHLRGLGVGPEVLVGILLERSVELIVGILGVLKAGGAFVPLDPAYPKERLAFMVDDAGLSILLTQQSLLATLPAKNALCLDTDWSTIAQHSPDDPESGVDPDNLAYTIYTSGSTGQPKGVLIQHRGVSNLGFAQREAFAVSAESRVLQFASISFDAAISEIFKTLLTGATLVVAAPESLLPVDPLLNLLRSQSVTTVTLPPSVWAVLPAEKLPSLRTAISAGEACSSQIVGAWSRDGRRFVNAYGPTEVTVCATISAPLDASVSDRPPIGSPIVNTQVHVLDSYLHPAPVGVVGELYVGGIGLARGYLHRPELTAERFVPDPFSSEPGRRLYRTGDLGRYLADGNLEYTGRVDHQVKVRGFRIELGEIETALLQHPSVRDAVVVAREDTPGDKRLVAYLITEPGGTADVSQWRAWLLQKLPDYMLPAAFVSLKEFPRTPNGKVDRRALPAPDANRPEQAHAYVAPRDKLEQFLVDLWQPTLGLRQVGVKDNFFDIGGNSLKGAVLINRLQELIGEYVYVVAIFDAPTIADLANYLRRHYPEAVNRICGSESSTSDTTRRQITPAQIAEFKHVIPPLAETPEHAADKTKNPSAIFVLSPPRSGSTLMRVMLGGHPQLFAPPELELLSFNTLAERCEAFADRFSFWREGTIRALMEIKQCDADAATRLMEQSEDERLTTKQFYALMQSWLGQRMLVDKTPSYALDIEVLRRAEGDFTDTRYIHLIRHPYAMIRSFVNARLEQVFFRHEHNYSRRELAELVWLASQNNILNFLETVPAERKLNVHFESLVNEPERVLRGICEFLGIEYVSEMATPYQGSSKRMTDGIHPLSKMLGDVKFHEHKAVDAGIAERWRQELAAGDLLADETWTVAEHLGYQRLASRPELRPIRRVESGRGEGLPLSFAQQRLWVIDQLEPDSSAYNIPLAELISGPLNVAALEQSFNELVRRHESLRTTFQIANGQPVQIIREPQSLRLEVVDLTHLPPAERESEAERQTHDEAQQPFDLINGPLLRVRLLKLDEAEHMLLLTMHHIISDGWSMEVLVRELTTLYDAFSEQRPSPLPELPLQYVDFALWQRDWLHGEVLEQQLAYWKQQLGGTLPVLALPLDHPRPPVRTTRTSHEAIVVSEAARAALRQIGQQEGATMFMTLLAVFKLLLARLSGQDDILVGTPIAGRSRAELESLIGFFVNTLVLRTDLSGDPTFRELVQRVRAVSLGAYKYQDFPFEKLVDELRPERDPSLTPLFQVMFMFENVSDGEIKLRGLQFTPARAENESGKFDLTLGMVETSDELVAVLRYNTALFNSSTVKRFLGCFENLLEGIVESPDRRISQFDMLGVDERAQLLEQAKSIAFPARCAHELFEEQVERRSNATALVFEKAQLSYRELNARANQLAHYLRGLGVGPETLVGVCVDRGVEMIAGLLGILKAGGAFVPLDPNYPQDRLQYMVADAGLSLVLTQEHLRDRIPARDGLTTICLDSDWSRLPDDNLQATASLDNLAYAIYTSGSTGRPKGVLLHHRGLTNLALAQARAFGVSEDSRVLQFASFSFDATVSEIFKTLLSGATLVVAKAESLLPVTPLLDLLREQRITMVTLPPSVLAVLPAADLPDLQTVISAGEACSAEIVANWSRDGRRFLNAYGPTEVTVCATSTDALDGSYKPPIGKPIANTEAYVLDSNLQPVPTGVVGELYIGGAGVARGYLGRPELTAERFIPHPFAQQSGQRFYRTGDLASFREDGQLDYRGRIDHQVKVRGFRIELEEIEAVLAQHKDVRDAVVLAREDVPGDKRLVAYLVTADGVANDVGQWRAWLSQQLPDYMLPAAFVTLDAFPLTRNGKIDRAALPAPDSSRPSQEQAYVAPRDQLERLLVDLWQPVLGLKELGVHDNFFEVGGDSIKGAILINQLQQLLGEYVYVVAIFDAPTVAQLANYLRRHYPSAVNRVCGVDVTAKGTSRSRVSREQIAAFRQSIPALPELPSPLRSTHKNPPAVFVLSPPRSGSTLLRVMLGGHPQLFAPPELELLSFNTLADRKAEFGERFAFWLEGTVRALMQLKQCSAEEAKEIMAACEAEQLTTQQFYARLQSWLGERILVDKTPSYALDLEILRRAESDFAETRYIHLLRHPFAMIRSFEEARLEQVFFRHEHNFERRELAELIWLLSQENILQFLKTVPSERQHQVHFEELVTEPERVLRGVCEFLGLEYVEAMAAPYQKQEQRMVDGIHPLSKMLGDVKFHEHKSIEAATADRWRSQLAAGDRLADETWTIAEELGYPRVAVDEAKQWSPLVELQRGDSRPPLFFVHPGGGNVFCYMQLAHHLGTEQSFYGLQSLGLIEKQTPLTEISEMATRYLEELYRVQPEGPYAVGGWSMGGLVAFEMAQQLTKAGHEVALLAMLDTYTPAVLNEIADTEDEELERQFKADMSALYGAKGPGVDSEQLDRFFQVFRANVQAMLRYQPERYPGRITFFRAGTRLADVSYDPSDDWRSFVAEGVEVHVVPGDHYTMLHEPAVQVLADWLKVCLNINRVEAASI